MTRLAVAYLILVTAAGPCPDGPALRAQEGPSPAWPRGPAPPFLSARDLLYVLRVLRC